MNKNTGIIVGVIALVVVAGGAYAFMSGPSVQKDDTMVTDTMEKEADTMMKEEDGMVKEADTMMKKDEMMKVGSYEAYAAEKIARAETGDVVLFFHAAWCPSCRGLNSDIEANMSAIPEGLNILKLNYDTETELKKKYGVTTQHTLVQVDKDGNLIKKWSGGSSLASVISQVN